MNDLFSCPPQASLGTAPNPSCPVRFDQIQKMLLRRVSGATALTTATILLSATVTPLFAASDSTKVMISPWLLDAKIPASEPTKQGGNDNTTLNGIPSFTGFGFVNVTAQLRNVDFTTAKAMRDLASESSIIPGATNIEGIFVNRFGKLIIDNPSGTVAQGFKIYNFAVSDVSSEGLHADNIFNVSFDLEPLWSQTAKILTPTDWNPLTVSN